MQQTIIKFKFKFKSNDFYISNKNELAYKFIKSWPDWPTKIAYIYGSEKCGKTSICKLWMKLSKSIYVNKNNFLRRLIPQDNLDFIKSRNWIIDDVDHIIHFKKTLGNLLFAPFHMRLAYFGMPFVIVGIGYIEVRNPGLRS